MRAGEDHRLRFRPPYRTTAGSLAGNPRTLLLNILEFSYVTRECFDTTGSAFLNRYGDSASGLALREPLARFRLRCTNYRRDSQPESTPRILELSNRTFRTLARIPEEPTDT